MSVDVAEATRECGADLLGFVFALSRRRIEVQVAENIAREVSGIGKVGVFVNAPATEVNDIAKRCKLDFVQLHGEESPEYCRLIRYPVIKAVRVGADFDPQTLADYDVQWILLDSFVAGQQGGTGVAFDWRQVECIRQQIKIPLFVAGGLHAENVEEAVRILAPEGIDVSGGVETNGIKDIEKIRQFIIAARSVKGGAGNYA